MKNTLGLLILLFCSTHLLAQGTIEPTDNISKMLCRTWRLKYMEGDGQRIEATPDMTYGITVTFKLDNTYRFGSPSKAIYGTWKYDLKQKMIIAKPNGTNADENSLNIVSLNETEMKQFAKDDVSGRGYSGYFIYVIVKK